MTKEIYRTAIIGLGAVGKRMLTHMMDHPRFEPVVGFDVRTDSLHNFERPVGSFKLTKDISTLLETKGIDLLYVSTPPKFHAQAVHSGFS
ncbi:MAG TPA: hypothetical protein DCR61_15010 [Verrucomicrobiales bacterium]|nr:hypothetical protein [Verrucomicrobiales bacterium]